MLEPKKILVPVDFSAYSSDAVRRASRLAKVFDAEVIVVHVVAPSLYPQGMGFGAPSEAEMMDELRGKLSDLAEKEIDAGITCSTEVLLGTPSAMIIDAAESRGVDWIIMPTHGHSGLKHALLGSTAEKVVRGAKCDVHIVRCRLESE